jgi:hypothetical protein
VRLHGYIRPDPDLLATTSLQLRIDSGFDGKTFKTWRDDQDGRLETKIAGIAAAIIVAGDADFGLGLKRAEDRAERERLDREQRRLQKLAELNKQRIADFHKSGELLRQAQEIRALIGRVPDALRTSRADVDPAASPHRSSGRLPRPTASIL